MKEEKNVLKQFLRTISVAFEKEFLTDHFTVSRHVSCDKPLSLPEGRCCANSFYSEHSIGTRCRSRKTYVMIAAAMEMRRMGLSEKNMFVVPNNIVGQWKTFSMPCTRVPIFFV